MVKLLEISDASIEKAASLIVRLMDDNAKLHKELAKKEEETDSWKNLHDKSGVSGMTMKVVVEELMDDLKKLHIEPELQVEESLAAVKQSNEDVKKEMEALRAQRSIEK